MIKKTLLISFIFLFTFGKSFCQKSYLLLGEGKQDEVRLFWTPTEKWPENLVGFNIKRKTTGEWSKINADVIVPGTNGEKSLSNLNLGRSQTDRLAQKRNELISSGILKSINTQELIEIMNTKNNVESVSIMLNSDFDIALIAGFGIIDTNIPKTKGAYIYGLFPVFTTGEAAEPVQQFSWSYGTSPDIDVSMEGNAKINGKREEVELVYKIDTKSYKSYEILNGFNILRKQKGDQDFTKLNQNPIWVSLKLDRATLYYKDDSVDLNKSYVYAVAPNTIFNTNGVPSEIEVSAPVEVDESITPPTLLTPAINESNNQLSLKWEFDPSFEESIKGFYVQLKDKDGNLFTNVSELFQPNTRSFVYQLPSADNGYYHFKVIAIRNDDLELWSNRKIFYHKVSKVPSAPLNLKGTVEGSSINLTWGKPEENSDAVVRYDLYTSSPNEDELIREGSLSITSTDHVYEIYRSKAAIYKFAVSASNAAHEESVLSDTLEVTFPSNSLPFVNIWPVTKEGNSVTLNWKYPDDIADLAGFRLYQNGEMILDQVNITQDQRKIVVKNLETGTYTFEIEAISTFEVTSDKSKPRTFEIE